MSKIVILLVVILNLVKFSFTENPIRRVVKALQKIQKEIETEFDKEEDDHKKFTCYCDKNKLESQSRSENGNSAANDLSNQIADMSAQVGSLTESLDELKKELSTNQESLNEATAVREKGIVQFKADLTELDQNIQALQNAIPALESKLEGPESLLSKISKFSKISERLTETNKGSGGSSSEILGILKQMLDDFQKDRVELKDAEEKNLAAFDDLSLKKTNIIKALNDEISNKSVLLSETKTAHTKGVEDLEDVNVAIIENNKFSSQLGQNCETAAADYEKVQADRKNELAAINDVIEMLNNDDSLDLFNKSLKKTKNDEESTAFLSEFQKVVKDSEGSVGISFVQILKHLHRHIKGASKQLLQSSRTHSNSLRRQDDDEQPSRPNQHVNPVDVSVQPIINILDENVAQLRKLQKEEAEQKAHCDSETSKLEQSIKETQETLDSKELKRDEISDRIKTTNDEISKLNDEIIQFKTSIEELTKERKEQHELFLKESKERIDTVNLLRMAIDRLSKFYGTANSKETTSTSEDTTDESDETKTDEDDTSLVSLDPPKRRDVQHERKNVASANVSQLLQKLIQDTQLESKDAKNQEADSVKEFEKITADLNENIKSHNEAISDKNGANAEDSEKLEFCKNEIDGLEDSLGEFHKQLETLTDSCKFVVEDYEQRVADRKQELENIKDAKAILREAV